MLVVTLGQPATGGAEQGQMPLCNVALGNAAGGCTVNAVWTGGNSYPHLRDGCYRAWSIVRAVCDTASATCSFASDHFGTEALVRYAQDDIHNSIAKSVADFLPLSDDGSFGPVGTHYGDAQFVRSHYAFNSRLVEQTLTIPTTTPTRRQVLLCRQLPSPVASLHTT